MRRRHPHLWGDGPPVPWAELKARERAERPGGGSVLDSLSSGVDPLLRAFQLQARVAELGFDWDDWRGAWEKVREETEEVRHELEAGDADALEDEVGDLMFAAVNLARLGGAHPTAALSRANEKFARRFRALEALAGEKGVVFGQATLEELDLLWDEVKRRERASSASTGPAATGGAG